jgi:hypothetical protein
MNIRAVIASMTVGMQVQFVVVNIGAEIASTTVDAGSVHEAAAIR